MKGLDYLDFDAEGERRLFSASYGDIYLCVPNRFRFGRVRRAGLRLSPEEAAARLRGPEWKEAILALWDSDEDALPELVRAALEEISKDYELIKSLNIMESCLFELKEPTGHLLRKIYANPGACLEVRLAAEMILGKWKFLKMPAKEAGILMNPSDRRAKIREGRLLPLSIQAEP